MACPGYSPVFAWGAATGFDSGEPPNRRKIERTTRTAVERNSDCQFWALEEEGGQDHIGRICRNSLSQFSNTAERKCPLFR